jgi:hypothetical protein
MPPTSDKFLPEEPANAPHFLSELLLNFANDLQTDTVQFKHLAQLLGDRSFGFILLLFALPNCLPIVSIPGVSTIAGIPLALVALQVMFGANNVYLPRWVESKSFSSHTCKRFIYRVAPWLQRLERLMKPRWLILTSPSFERAIGLICFLLALVLIMPIPLGNVLPGLCILMMAFGLMERDGVFIAVGFFLTLISLVVLSSVVWLMIKAALLFFQKLFH